MEKYSIKTDAGNEYFYYIDQIGDITSYGIGISPITDEINCDLIEIQSIDLDKIILSKNEIRDLNYCNMDIIDLIGKYFDKNGYVYYSSNENINRFSFKINNLKKLYKKAKTKAHNKR